MIRGMGTCRSGNTEEGKKKKVRMFLQRSSLVIAVVSKPSVFKRQSAQGIPKNKKEKMAGYRRTSRMELV